MCFLLGNIVHLNQLPQITKWQFGTWDIQGPPLYVVSRPPDAICSKSTHTEPDSN